MAKYHDARFPGDAVTDVIAEAKARRFHSVEAVDAAIEVVGCGNAMRDGGNGPFGAAAVPETEDEAAALADEADSEGFGAEGDGAEGIGGEIAKRIAMFILRKFLGL